MSLFIDVNEQLSNALKANLLRVIESERKDQERPIRKSCETCMKYLEYGELRYDKMEDGIREVEKRAEENPLFILLLAVFNESLDEDDRAIDYFKKFSASSMAAPFRIVLDDFIAVGTFVTLGRTNQLEDAATRIIERYSDEKTISDILSNMYLKIEDEQYIPVFLRLMEKARSIFADSISVETLTAFFAIKGSDYEQAIAAYNRIRMQLEKNTESTYFHYNMALTWDNMAGCYLKMGDATKALECCNTALGFQEKAGETPLGNSSLYKKAEAFLLTGDKEHARQILEPLIKENPEDETALELMKNTE